MADESHHVFLKVPDRSANDSMTYLLHFCAEEGDGAGLANTCTVHLTKHQHGSVSTRISCFGRRLRKWIIYAGLHSNMAYVILSS